MFWFHLIVRVGAEQEEENNDLESDFEASDNSDCHVQAVVELGKLLAVIVWDPKMSQNNSQNTSTTERFYGRGEHHQQIDEHFFILLK